MMEKHLKLTHLLHGELFEHRVIFMEPEPAEPVQDAVLLCGAGQGQGQGLGQWVGQGARQGVALGVREGM